MWFELQMQARFTQTCLATSSFGDGRQSWDGPEDAVVIHSSLFKRAPLVHCKFCQMRHTLRRLRLSTDRQSADEDLALAQFCSNRDCCRDSCVSAACRDSKGHKKRRSLLVHVALL
jgi:hypothetical protein